jgi:pimeloyl-ACP methyl ester carboxylesterase
MYVHRRRGVALMGVLGLVGALVAGAPAAAREPVAGQLATEVGWAACPAEVTGPPRGQVQCASVSVPLDYSDPGGDQIEIMVSRIASTNAGQRRGVLLTNPGGPGYSGLDFPGLLIQQGLPASVMDAYDLIGMDPRGVGHSSPVSCGFTTGEPYSAHLSPYALDDAAVIEWAEVVEAVAAKCAENDTDGRLRHITTANTARDLDRIRVALGEEKASFYGASYGSALGAAYASMFPDTTDRIVVDSIVGSTYLDHDVLRRFGLGFEETFPDFARWAAARHASYGLGRTPEQVRRTYFTIAERLDRTPAADGTDGAAFRYGTLLGLYGESAYGVTAQSWQWYLNPESVPATKLAADPNPADNVLTAFLAIVCNDVEWPRDLATYRRAVAEDRERYPMFGAAAANIMPCAYWQYEPSEAPVGIIDEGPANVLILQNRRDPATPYEGALMLHEKFGERSRLVVAQESGHGVYVLGGNSCALNITTSYLVGGKLPAKDTTCRRG